MNLTPDMVGRVVAVQAGNSYARGVLRRYLVADDGIAVTFGVDGGEATLHFPHRHAAEIDEDNE